MATIKKCDLINFKGELIDHWTHSSGDEWIVSSSIYRGARRLDVRRWYPVEGGYKAGKRGVSIKSGDIPKLRKALRRADKLLMRLSSAKDKKS